MAITQSITHNQVRNTAVGRITATSTPVAIVVSLGFKPRYVSVQNSSERVGVEFFEGMTAANAIKTVAAGTRTLITSLGITVADTGFTIGLDTDLAGTDLGVFVALVLGLLLPIVAGIPAIRKQEAARAPE